MGTRVRRVLLRGEDESGEEKSQTGKDLAEFQGYQRHLIWIVFGEVAWWKGNNIYKL